MHENKPDETLPLDVVGENVVLYAVEARELGAVDVSDVHVHESLPAPCGVDGGGSVAVHWNLLVISSSSSLLACAYFEKGKASLKILSNIFTESACTPSLPPGEHDSLALLRNQDNSELFGFI